MKIVLKKPENCHFYSREILQYIARTCLRNRQDICSDCASSRPLFIHVFYLTLKNTFNVQRRANIETDRQWLIYRNLYKAFR